MTRNGTAFVATVLIGLACWTSAARAQYDYGQNIDPNSRHMYQSYSQTVYDPAQGSYSIQYHSPAPQAQYQQYGGYSPQPAYQQNAGYAQQGASQQYAYPNGTSYQAPQAYAAPAAASAAPVKKRSALRVARGRNVAAYPQQAASAARPVQVARRAPITAPYASTPSYGGYGYQGQYCAPGRA